MTPGEMCFIGFSIRCPDSLKAASGLSQLSANYPFLCTEYRQTPLCLLSRADTFTVGPINTRNKYDALADIGKCKVAQLIYTSGSQPAFLPCAPQDQLK